MVMRTIAIGVVAVLGMAGVGYRILQSGTPQPEIPLEIRQMLMAQQKLPEAEVRAIQGLRVLAAVQAVYFTQHQSYAPPQELKSAGMLDPAWPRVDAAAYQISCIVEEERIGFECHADPVPPYSNSYFVNPSQVVRVEKKRRADENSPVFGISKETS